MEYYTARKTNAPQVCMLTWVVFTSYKDEGKKQITEEHIYYYPAYVFTCTCVLYILYFTIKHLKEVMFLETNLKSHSEIPGCFPGNFIQIL